MCSVNRNKVDRLVASHAGLVYNMARRYAGFGHPMSDLISEGNLGLLKAIERFDNTKGCSLATYAAFWIRSQLNKYVMDNWSIVRVGGRKEDRKRFFKESSSFCKDSSLNAKIEDGIEMIDILPSSIDIEQEYMDKEKKIGFRRQIRSFLKTIPPREKDIFARRKLKPVSDSLETLSQKHGISKERIRQIENNIFLKFKEYVLELPPLE